MGCRLNIYFISCSMDSDLNQCWNCRKEGRFHCETCKFAFYCSKNCEQTDRYRHGLECETATQMQTCAGCFQRPATLLRCGACFVAYYCNKACQFRHWPRHKKTCKEVKNIILDTVGFCKIVYETRMTPVDLPGFIGRSIAEDYLRLHQNEGSCIEHELRLLFVGLSDIKDVICTITDLPQEFKGNVHIVVNDHGPHVSARNLLLMYCALAHPIAEYLVQIWYSLHLTPIVLKYLVARLKELTTFTHEDVLNKMRNYVHVSSDHWRQCIQIWKGWYHLALDTEAAEKMLQIRQKTFSIARERIRMNSFTDVPQEHFPSFKDFIDKGLLFPLDSLKRREAVFPNCTMACYNPLNPKYEGKFVDICPTSVLVEWTELLSPTDEKIYALRTDVGVLNCWDYLVVKKTVGKKDDVLDMYLTYLTRLFQSFIDQIGSGCTTFRFIVDDFQRLDRYFTKNETFDRISVSNLGDYYCFPLLLKQFGPRLNKRNNCSVLISRHQNWPIALFNQLLNCPENFFERRSKYDKLCFCMKSTSTYRTCTECQFDAITFFLFSLSAEAVTYTALRDNCSETKDMIKHPAQVAQKFGLRLRDYCLELNHVVPFKRESNARHISMLKSNKRYLEWTLSC